MSRSVSTTSDRGWASQCVTESERDGRFTTATLAACDCEHSRVVCLSVLNPRTMNHKQ